MGSNKNGYNLAFQCAGKGYSDDITFGFSGGTLSDKVDSFGTSIQVHSGWENGGRYDYYNIEDASFYPTKEFLETQTKRVIDDTKFTLIELPLTYPWNDDIRSFWYTRVSLSSLNSLYMPPRDQLIDKVYWDNYFISHVAYRWNILDVSNGKFATIREGSQSSTLPNLRYADFDRLLEVNFQGLNGQATEIAPMTFAEKNKDTELLTYNSFMPYPYEQNRIYAIKRTIQSEEDEISALMAVWVGTGFFYHSHMKGLGLTPRFILEQSLLALGSRYEGDLLYSRGEAYEWKERTPESDVQIYSLGFSPDIPGATLIEESIGTLPPFQYWEGGVGATSTAYMDASGNDLWCGTATALAANTLESFDEVYSSVYYTSSPGQDFYLLMVRNERNMRSRLACRYNSNNTDEAQYEDVDIRYMFLFKSDGSVDFISELSEAINVPRGCSIELDIDIYHDPTVIII